MLSRRDIFWLCALGAICMGGSVAATQGGELAGPPVTVAAGPSPGITPGGTPVEKAKVPKAEALPLGKPLNATSTVKGSEKSSSGIMDPGTATTVGALVAVLAVIGAVAVFARKASLRAGGLWAALGPGGRAPSGILEVLGRYPVGRGCTLVLLKLDRRILLVSQSSGGKLGGVTMTTLCEVDEAEDVASILLKSRDAETEQSMQRFEHMLTDADKAYATRGEIPIEPVPLPLRNVKRAAVGNSGGGDGQALTPMQSRLANLRGRARLEVRG